MFEPEVFEPELFETVLFETVLFETGPPDEFSLMASMELAGGGVVRMGSVRKRPRAVWIP